MGASRRKGAAWRFTASASRKILAELVEISSAETLELHSVESWLRNWVAGKEGSTAETTVKKYRQTCTSPNLITARRKTGVAVPSGICDGGQIKPLFGFARATAYNLLAAGKIKSVTFREKGKLRGKRLFNCESIRSFLARCEE
jgi:hypothetical protein